MPPHLESDDVDDIKTGTYVYWMRVSEDVAERGELGEVVRVDDNGRRKVSFPKGNFSIEAVQLNVSDFQKGTFVHMTDEDPDLIGEIKELDNGKLQVDFEGKQKILQPKKLIRCDFQPGMFAFWTKSDEDIPPGHMGEVQKDLTDKGRVRVKFPKGKWNFKPCQMVRASIQLRSLVLWTDSSDDIAKGEVGQVIQGPNDEGKVEVQFAKGAWRFHPEDLYQIETQLHSFVTWEKHDEDVLKGDVGEVKKVKVDRGRLSVQFPKGTWSFKVNDLKMYRLQPGHLVHWQKCDEDIERGDIGEVVRRAGKGNRFSVQWPQGNWCMKPIELEKVAFQRDDRVQWTGADDDIPKGHIGQVMGVKYVGKGNAGKSLYVRFPNGFWSFKPHQLKYINLDNDAVNELKATFKRFDKNGDGKLSLEEMSAVLGNLGGGCLSDDECKQLFDALDKDGNGKLTADEFIDYVFGTEVSGSQKKLLSDGFGLSGMAGINDDESEEDDDDDDPNSGGGGGNQDHDQLNFDVTFDAEDKEGIDGDTMVTKAEWASAMLTVGVCRAAAIESFEGALADLGEEGEEVAVKYLAMEINGTGSGGIEELRGAVGRVKHGKVPPVELETPAEEVEFEVELARKTGIDGLLRHLQVTKKSPDDAVGELADAKLSSLEAKVLGDMGDDLVDAVKEAAKKPSTLSAASSYQRARENCRKEVQEIIDGCKSSGEKFVDTTWDPNADENFVLYVDKEKPGWDCTARKPTSGWKRAKEVWEDGKLVIGDAAANDIDQGRCGDCFMLGALGAIAANRKRFIRQVFVHYDEEVGVYGVLFCVEGNFTYEIIDDYLGMKYSHSVMYAESMTKNEMWVSLVEKAYFKHLTCIEMCDGGHGTETMFSFLGGVTGKYEVGSKFFDKPDEYFSIIDKALKAGELMTTGWYAPSKGKYANLEGGEGGPCGETGLPYGLIGGHCYSVIRTAEHDGKKFICCRNPWGKGEWKGAYSDASEEMTDELKEALDHANKVDGTFWMALEDFVQVSKRCAFLKQFGPTWQCSVLRGHFTNDVEKGRAKKDCQAAEDNEISFKKGDMIEVTEIQGFWSKGKNLKSGRDPGFYRSKDVEIQMKNVLKITLDVEDIQEGEPLIFAFIVENQLMRREWAKRKADGLNYKDKQQPSGLIFMFDKNGKKHKGMRLKYRHYWEYLDPAKAPWTIYMAVCKGKGMRYNAYGYARHGNVHLKYHEISYSDFLDEYNS